MQKEKINITIPVFNRSDLIKRAVENALKIEKVDSVTIVNDGSNEETHRAILDFAGFEKINYIRLHKNAGADTARNISILLSDFDWVSFHDSDDLYDRQKIKKQIAHARRYSADAAFCQFVFFDMEGNLSVRGSKIRLLQDLFTNVVFENNFENYILINPGLFSKKVFETLGGYKMGRIGGDDDMQYRLVLSGRKICFVNEPLILKFDSEDSLTIQKDTNLQSEKRLNFYKYLHENIERLKENPEKAAVPIDLPEDLEIEIIYGDIDPQKRKEIPITEAAERVLSKIS